VSLQVTRRCCVLIFLLTIWYVCLFVNSTAPFVRPFTADVAACRNKTLIWSQVFNMACGRQIWLSNNRIRTLNAIASHTLWVRTPYVSVESKSSPFSIMGGNYGESNFNRLQNSFNTPSQIEVETVQWPQIWSKRRSLPEKCSVASLRVAALCYFKKLHKLK